MEKIDISILEKLRGHYLDGVPVASVSHEDYTHIKTSIRDHLELILNERRGILAHVDAYFRDVKNSHGYGLPELSDFFFSSSSKETRRERLRAAVEFVIKEFEPRLTNVKIDYVEDGRGGGTNSTFDSLALKLHLTASLRPGSSPDEEVEFETIFLPDKATQVGQIIRK